MITMMIGAVKCDGCGHLEEMENSGQGGVKVKDGWMKVSPIITIQGTTHAQGRTEAFIKKKNKLKEIIRHSHYCPACVEKMTGDYKGRIEWNVVYPKQ